MYRNERAETDKRNNTVEQYKQINLLHERRILCKKKFFGRIDARSSCYVTGVAALTGYVRRIRTCTDHSWHVALDCRSGSVQGWRSMSICWLNTLIFYLHVSLFNLGLYVMESVTKDYRTSSIIFGVMVGALNLQRMDFARNAYAYNLNGLWCLYHSFAGDSVGPEFCT